MTLGVNAPRYRSDIDGLRAIAVVPVVLFHVGFTLFSGGFVGVDVFFVISGYLITQLLLNDIRRGTFSISGFYERRIRRIFPALFAVIAASALAAWFIFMPGELAYFARSAAAAALFSSNILFFSESGYFDAEAHLKPLLHTWSLAVEEQFYIVFPLLLFGVSRRAWPIARVLVGLWLVSFALSLYAQQTAPLFNFYWAPPRFWELLTGAVLAAGIVPVLSTVASRWLIRAGLGLIAISVFVYDENTAFPGLTALVPCLGAAFVIHGGSAPAATMRLLSAGPVVQIGLMSYSLYLWHWPVIVFTRYVNEGQISLVAAITIVVVSFAFAYVSWRWIERPFRGKGAMLNRRGLFMGALLLIATTVIVGVTVSFLHGLPTRLPIAAQSLYAARDDRSVCSSPKYFVPADEEVPRAGMELRELCSVGATDEQRAFKGALDFVVWGDSHAAAMAPAIDKIAREHGRTGSLLGRGSCPPLLDFDTGASNRNKIKNCMLYNAAALRFIADKQVAVVFLVARWPKYVHHSEYGNEGIFFDPNDAIMLDDFSAELAHSLGVTLSAISKAGAKAVIVMDVPEMGYDVPHALAKASMTGDARAIVPERQAVRRRQALAVSVLTAAAKQYDAKFIDPTERICDATVCRVRAGNIVLYADEDHLTKSGAEYVAPVFESLFADWPQRPFPGLPLGKTDR